eukprot:10725877-Alexandrium_andersonii.AAC.1
MCGLVPALKWEKLWSSRTAGNFAVVGPPGDARPSTIARPPRRTCPAECALMHRCCSRLACVSAQVPQP